MAAQWEELAIALGFEAVIERIRRDYVQDARGACRHVLTEWLAEKAEGNLRGPVTWTTLIDCLIDAGFAGLAEQLKEVKSSN